MTDAIDLTTEQRKTLIDLTRRFLPGVAVWAYGSRVKWTARPNSDLDLVAFTSPAQQPQVADLEEALAESNLPFPVNLHVWDEVPERFREIIRKEYVVVQEAKEPDGKRGLAGEWPAAPLSVLAELSGGFAFKSADYAPSGRFILRTLNISDDCSINRDDAVYLPEELCPQYSRFELKAQDTLFVMVGATLGKVGFVREKDLPALLNQNMWLIRANPERADSRFVHYAFRHSVKESLGWASGSARDFVRRDDYRNLMIPSPSLMEQRAIAHILGTLDDKIELNRRMNETLEAMARALFKSWFVDFDPVRAKAEDRDPSLPKPLADLFPDSFDDSPLGEIPSGWQVGSILDHARLMSGGTPKTDQPQYWNGSIAWASAKDVSQSNGSFLVETERTITERGLEESATQMIPALCSVVVARGATTGRMVLFGRDMAMNQTCYALVTTTETPFALYCRLRQEIEALVHAAHGSVFDTITTSTFASSRIVLPPQIVLKAFEQRATPVFQRVLRNIRECRTLATLRDTLLPKLISGELRIEDAERIIHDPPGQMGGR